MAATVGVLVFFGLQGPKGTRIGLEFTAGNLQEPAVMLSHRTTNKEASNEAMHVIITYQCRRTHGTR
jgi:hypothetical protein